jgi:hypothetical protein
MSKSKTEMIDLSKIRGYILRHPHGLPADLKERAKRLWEQISAYHHSRTWEKWEFGFCCDTHPDQQIQVYEWIVAAWSKWVTKYPKSDKQEALEWFEVLSTGNPLPIAAKLGRELLRVYFSVGGQISPIVLQKAE